MCNASERSARVLESPASRSDLTPRRPWHVRVIDMAWSIGRCYHFRIVRSLLITLLALFVVFQSSWALAAPYCQHERTIASAHFGHHEHEHEAPAVTASGDNQDASASKAPAGLDVDCSTCHASSPALVLPATPALSDPRQSERISRVPTAAPAALSARIERPNWPALA